MMEDLTRDPALSAALRGMDGDAAQPDWAALHGRISAAAQLPLARRRSVTRSFPFRHARVLLPLAAAAGIAGVAWTSLPRRGAPLTPAERSEIEAAVRDGLPDQVRLLLSGEAAEAALMEEVGVPPATPADG